ncbi:hypothetical protein [Kribbella deserti]|uniref:Uncharacterized protein n=1 Tax=Kribbella deserti TaxID=1926257 RepID=A0ABV6QNB0_9ACTN
MNGKKAAALITAALFIGSRADEAASWVAAHAFSLAWLVPAWTFLAVAAYRAGRRRSKRLFVDLPDARVRSLTQTHSTTHHMDAL